MATNTNLAHKRLMDVNVSPWDYQVAAKGTVGTNLDVTPASGDKKLHSMVITAPNADADATLKIYKDSAVGGNLIFDGYLANLDGNSSIIFSTGTTCETKWIVAVSGGSGDLFVLARYL